MDSEVKEDCAKVEESPPDADCETWGGALERSAANAGWVVIANKTAATATGHRLSSCTVYAHPKPSYTPLKHQHIRHNR